jgi:hypothetical protein
MPPFRLFLPLTLLFIFTACEKKKPVALPPPPPPPLTRVEAAPQKDRLIVDDAMTVKDVTFVLRSGGSDVELVAEIARRGLVDKIDDATAKELIASGASPTVIAALRDPRNILTVAEKARFNERSANRKKAQAKH